MTKGLFDGAEWRGPIGNRYVGGVLAHKGIVLHIMQGTLAGTDSWFKNPQSQVSAHFGVGKDGTIYQWVNADDVAWAEVRGNPYWISVENEGDSGQMLTDAQVTANAKIYVWAHRFYGCKIQLASEPAGEGLGYHAMGGADWGGHLSCPGAPIVGQRSRILGEVDAMLKIKPTPPWYQRVLRDKTPMLRGADVAVVQRKVNVKVDEVYGPATAAKVKGYQTVHKLKADGVVGPATARALGK